MSMLEPGHKFLHYQVEARLGRSGLGDVYRATDQEKGRRVAIRQLARVEEGEPLRLYLRDLRIAMRLRDPHIVPVLALHDVESNYFVVMEHVDGEPLRARLDFGPMSQAEIVRLGREVGQALMVAHEAGVIHRDLRPSNILLTSSGEARVSGFGMGRLPDEPGHAHSGRLWGGVHELTGSPVLAGTMAYLAPEQVRGEEVDFRADLFALGTILYEAATGQKAFPAGNPVDVMYEIVHREPTPPSDVRSGLPRRLDATVHGLMEKDRSHRFPSARDFLADLQQLEDAGWI